MNRDIYVPFYQKLGMPPSNPLQAATLLIYQGSDEINIKRLMKNQLLVLINHQLAAGYIGWTIRNYQLNKTYRSGNSIFGLMLAELFIPNNEKCYKLYCASRTMPFVITHLTASQ